MIQIIKTQQDKKDNINNNIILSNPIHRHTRRQGTIKSPILEGLSIPLNALISLRYREGYYYLNYTKRITINTNKGGFTRDLS